MKTVADTVADLGEMFEISNVTVRQTLRFINCAELFHRLLQLQLSRSTEFYAPSGISRS